MKARHTSQVKLNTCRRTCYEKKEEWRRKDDWWTEKLEKRNTSVCAGRKRGRPIEGEKPRSLWMKDGAEGGWEILGILSFGSYDYRTSRGISKTLKFSKRDVCPSNRRFPLPLSDFLRIQASDTIFPSFPSYSTSHVSEADFLLSKVRKRKIYCKKISTEMST